MGKIKILLYGKHSVRTPFSYIEYKKLFSQHFEYVNEAKKADFLVTGFRKDFVDNAEEILSFKKQNPNLKLVVFSEEPLWDTLWSGNFQKPKSKIKCKINGNEVVLDYIVINHVTSDIFNFENIPYFITTDNNFHVRYSNLFRRNINCDINTLKKHWENARIKYAFFAAKRIEDKYDVSYNNSKILGINKFRSEVADRINTVDTIKEGEGWGKELKRQALPDWHLDKLATLDKNSYIVSAMENTHMNTYVSEKIFDAFAVQSIPIYYAQKEHRVFNLAKEGSFINLSDLSIDEAILRIENFTINNEFIEKYQESQFKMNELFADINLYLNERINLVNNVVNHFDKL